MEAPRPPSSALAQVSAPLRAFLGPRGGWGARCSLAWGEGRAWAGRSFFILLLFVPSPSLAWC